MRYFNQLKVKSHFSAVLFYLKSIQFIQISCSVFITLMTVLK